MASQAKQSQLPRELSWSPKAMLDELRQNVLLALTGNGGSVAIRFDRIEFLSSKALTLLLELRQIAASMGKTILLKTNSLELIQLFHVVGFDRYFEVGGVH